MLRFFIRIILVSSLLLFSALAATAAQGEVFLAKMKVIKEINLGGVSEYEVECDGRGRAILKTSPLLLKTGEAVNLFVQEGAKEGGKPAYVALTADSARSFKEGFAAVRIGGSWSFIDKNGKLLSQLGFERATDFQEGFALVKMKEGFGFLGKDGELLPTPMLRTLDSENRSLTDMRTGFSDGVALMGFQTKDYKRVSIILDKSGSVIKMFDEATVDIACHFTEGLAAVRGLSVHEKHQFGFIDKSGNLTIPKKFSEAHPFKEGRAAVHIRDNPNNFGGKWGFIDKSGELVIDAKYDYTQNFSEELAAVKSGSKWGFIDKEGNVKVNIAYDEVFPFSEGLAVVKRGGLYGAIDKTGQVIIKFLYNDMKPFVNGLAPVYDKSSHSWGYIDKTGKFAIAAQFSEASSFSEGLALVRHDLNRVPRYKYINTKGQAALWFYMPR